jgi:hypothetical protein
MAIGILFSIHEFNKLLIINYLQMQNENCCGSIRGEPFYLQIVPRSFYEMDLQNFFIADLFQHFNLIKPL